MAANRYMAEICSLCSQHCDDKEEAGHCVTCGLHLCSKCLADHNKFPVLANHRIQYSDEKASNSKASDSDENFTDTNFQSLPICTCYLHNEKAINMFCPDHDEICCEICVFIKHRSCGGVVFINDVAKTLNGTDELKQVKELLDKAVKTIVTAVDNRKENILQLNKQKDRILTDIGKHEDEIVAKVRELAEASRQEVSKKHDTQVKAVEVDIKLLETFNSQSKEYAKKLSDTQTNVNHLFINLKRCRQHCKDSINVVDALSNNWLKTKLGFVFEKTLIKATNSLESVGEVVEETVRNAIYEAVYDRIINVQLEHDRFECEIMGICVLQNGQLVVCDHWNGRLKRFDSNYKLIDYITLTGGPVSMCVTGYLEVALAILEKKKVQFVSCGKQLKLNTAFHTDQSCTGLCYDSITEELYVCCWEDREDQTGIIDVYNKIGIALRRLNSLKPELSHPCHIVFSKENTIVLTDSRCGVKALDKNGKELWTFSDKSLERPQGICRMPGDQVLVTGCDTDNVIQLNKDGKKVCELIEAGKGLMQPSVLKFDEETSTLMVGGLTNYIYVFRLTRK